jgi:prophage antirepressor-like protein
MKLLTFDNETENFHVRSATLDGAPIFVGKDACAALEMRNHRQALSRLDSDERITMKMPKGMTNNHPLSRQEGVISNDPLGGSQEMVFITESGLYALILSSRKPSARKFRKWVTSVVLPAIREHGFYSVFGSEEDARLAKQEGRLVGQMAHIRESVEHLREPRPYNYGSIHEFLKSFGIDLYTPGQRLSLYRACRAKAAEHHARVFPLWSINSCRAVSCYPREIVRAALLETGHPVEPDLFDNLLAN